METDVETLAATGPHATDARRPTFAAMCAAIRAPTLVIQGT